MTGDLARSSQELMIIMNTHPLYLILFSLSAVMALRRACGVGLGGSKRGARSKDVAGMAPSKIDCVRA